MGSETDSTAANSAETDALDIRTRRSLIMKLADWQDRRSWDEFYRTYRRLIYAVARKAGLREDEAWDVVQETVLTIAKQSRTQAYDPERGSFKQWLWTVTRWRINDRFRDRAKDTAAPLPDTAAPQPAPVEAIPDSDSAFERLWDTEWQENLMKAALERVKLRVTPQQYQIFDYSVLRNMPAAEVRRKLGISLTQLYLARHRVGGVLKKEIAYLKEMES